MFWFECLAAGKDVLRQLFLGKKGIHVFQGGGHDGSIVQAAGAQVLIHADDEGTLREQLSAQTRLDREISG